jgi:hypothetical protein
MDAAVDLIFEAIKTLNELGKVFTTDIYSRPKSRKAIRSSSLELYQIFVGPDLL